MEILILIAAIAAIYVWGYNRLAQGKTKVDEGWSGITVQLKRRHDLVPQLVSTVKSAKKHELEIVQRINDTRALAMQAMATDDHEKMAETEAALGAAVKQFFAYTEDNPEIAATANMERLQQQLEETEDQIAASRRLFNGNAQAYNARVVSIPTNWIAGIHKFKAATFFEMPEAEVALIAEPTPIRLD